MIIAFCFFVYLLNKIILMENYMSRVLHVFCHGCYKLFNNVCLTVVYARIGFILEVMAVVTKQYLNLPVRI